MRPLRAFLAFTIFIISTGVLMAACGSDPAAPQTSAGPSSSGTGGSGPGEDICLLHNCNSDVECSGCSDGRNTCLPEEHRCVACNAATGTGCPDGEYCSSYGKCVPNGVACATDNGVPTISCQKSADCAACDPLHQVCNTATHKCVACTESDTSECQSTDICINDTCSPKCPKTCQVDNDCGLCGGPGAPAHACNAHKCSQCSATYACPPGESCNLAKGTCERPCGLEGQVKGICEVDEDCVGCGGEAVKCHVPLNGGHGTCGPAAGGCSDFGEGVVVLPEPWSKVTNLCSNDGDCSGVGVDVNVGKMLRDLTGYDQIKDAELFYGMNVCADISIGNNLSCGLCVPCKVDSDCGDIPVDQIAGDAFGPLGQVAAAILLDQIFGPNEHKIYMYCQSVAAGYGVCAPCAGLVNDCGVGPGGGNGMCGHDSCTEGDPLGANCGACEASVCAVDSYCCDTAWDATCVGEVGQYCAAACGGGNNCTHDVCAEGDKLNEACDSCTAAVCAADPYCCQTAWDSTCVTEVTDNCAGQSCP